MSTAMDSMTFYLLGDGSTYTRMLNQAAVASTTVSRQIQMNGISIQRMGNSIQGYANKAMGFLDRLAHKASSIATMGLGGLGAGMLPSLLGGAGILGMAAGGGWALKLAADAESAQVSFEVMLQSASAAKKMLADLNKFAADTPFEMPQLRNATQMLLQVGVAQNRIMPNLKALGDIAQGDGQKLHGLTYALSQVKTMGRLTGQDKNQMIGWGFNPLEGIAKMTNKSMPQVIQMMEKGQISFEMIEKSLEHVTGPSGRFFEGMLKGSRATKGLWSTLADTIKLEVTKIGETLIETLDIKGILSKLIAGAAVVGPKISSAFSLVLGYTVPIVKDVGASFIDFAKTYVVPAFMYIGSYIPVVWDVLQTLFKGIKNGLSTLATYVGPTIKLLMDLGRSIVDWVMNNTELVQSIALVVAGWAAFAAALVIIPQLFGLITGAAAILLNPFTLILAAVGGITYAFLKFTKSGQEASVALTAAWGVVSEQFGLLVDLIRVGEFEAAWAVTVANMKYVWASGIAYIQEIWIRMRGNLSSVWIALVQGFGVTWDKFVLLTIQGINLILSGLEAQDPTGMLKLGRIDTTGYEASVKESTQFLKDTLAENNEMTEASVAKVQKPAQEAKTAWEAAQVAAKKALSEGEYKKNLNDGGFGSTFLGKYVDLAGMAVDGIKSMITPATAEATNAGNQVGGAYAGAVRSAMGAIDAVKAGTSKAYDLLQAYKGQMNPSVAVTQNTKLTAEEEKKKELTTMATGITELVEQGRAKVGNVIEFATGLLG